MKKLKPEELMIGNWISFFGKTDTQVEGLSTWDDIIQNSNCAERPLNQFEPIELTEEWLLKFGFKIADHKEYNLFLSKDYPRNYLNIHTNTDGEQKITVFCSDEDESSFMLENIKHVHQLQNLYFALTNEELKIISHEKTKSN